MSERVKNRNVLKGAQNLANDKTDKETDGHPDLNTKTHDNISKIDLEQEGDELTLSLLRTTGEIEI
ncbi:hypothetical protein [Paenibacillus naphthalenovorans]|uniref:hypothetical protein n=1 Tax=Paenibacillus naphthalenovorans TaxID=162209 RepID=UPI003D2CD253